MPICEICNVLDIEDPRAEFQLGEYSALVARADEGCNSCKFFCDVIQTSSRWRERLTEIPGHIVFLASRRLDVRKADRLDRRTYSSDDLELDICVPEDYVGPKDDEVDRIRSIDDTEIDPDSSPKTFQDALAIARHLEISYLWIRDLCSNERDPAASAEELHKLGAIYSNSALIISVRTGDDLNSGIFSTRPIHCSPVLGQKKLHCLRPRMLRWTDAIDYGFSGRAAQERMLAPRTVHYTEHQMIWECAAGYQFEALGILDKQRGSGQVRQQ
ncbi:Uu.00g067920.m01.CDS01 [Anthostomella pinea]|uniref:Uu.00g067920.m01.CDS01 n=1 Tax=Anthostomella pinea TaxID=933095 RepID=A0AAI8VU71_9PEZI|nr:Uu.00g067920.m01.CDS01 [Anthostomella pinea]